MVKPAGACLTRWSRSFVLLSAPNAKLTLRLPIKAVIHDAAIGGWYMLDSDDVDAVPLSMYVAHVSEDGARFEAVREHLEEVAQMASNFANPFHAESLAYAAGLMHDIGKYSREFQRRILRNGPKVDHSTAGAVALSRVCVLLSYCIAGHHGGLPDGGVPASEDSTLYGRINRANHGGIPNCDAWHSEIQLPATCVPPFAMPPQMDASAVNKRGAFERYKYTCSFLTRMVFSCLVDADFLCTERFMRGGERKPLKADSLGELKDKLEEAISAFYPPIKPLNKRRCQLLDECKTAAARSRGVFSLTAPTGAGKTYALMRFALQHACGEPNRPMRRVIVAEPYTSIIEQNAEVYRRIFGAESVLEHHANYDFDAYGDDGVDNRLRLAAENWDAPVIVTTNVQLFESLYSNRTSRCRKLHNIAGSVIVLDEAQMIPAEHLMPCIRALSELVRNYGCSVVLSSATQPALSGYFEKEGLKVFEIASDVPELFRDLERVTYRTLGRVSDEELASCMEAQGSALCIVNSRKQALQLFNLIDNEKSKNNYYLTTLMHPMHRKRVLAEIKRRMKVEHQPCLVVATSLVEAGVDLDFPVVYRALAGIDSMVQAAGRCNREGERPVADSVVYLFEPEEPYRIPREVRQRAAVSLSVEPSLAESGRNIDLGSPDTVSSFFRNLYFYKGEDELDSERILESCSAYPIVGGLPSIDFKSVSERFRMIRDGSISIVVPEREVDDEIRRIQSGIAMRGDVRKLAPYSVSVYERDARELLDAGAIEKLGDEMFLLLDASRYKEKTGLDTTVVGGEGLFL